MNWKEIEQAILTWARDHHVPVTLGTSKPGQMIDILADVRNFVDINISELARAIATAVVVKVD